MPPARSLLCVGSAVFQYIALDCAAESVVVDWSQWKGLVSASRSRWKKNRATHFWEKDGCNHTKFYPGR